MGLILNFIHEYYISIAAVLHALIAVTLTMHILLFKEDVKSSIGWIALVLFSPILGGILYIALGINRVRRKAMRLRGRASETEFKGLSEKFEKLKDKLTVHEMQFIRLGLSIHPHIMQKGHTIEPLIDGDQAFPAMCNAIKNAKKEVLLCSYIFLTDKAGLMFIEACKEAAAKGVKVYILIDGVGSPWRPGDIRRRVKGIKNIKLAIFQPSLTPFTLPFMNLRNHRKIMVVDGETAFFGGINISEDNLIKEKLKKHRHDIHFEVKGPVVKDIAKLFEDDWNFTTKEKFKAYHAQEDYRDTNFYCRLIPDGPDENYGKIELLMLGIINSATESISIITPYLLPDNTILKNLEIASMRGVDVSIIIPEKSDNWFMDYPIQSYFERLLRKGINVYLTPEPFDHSKVMIADGMWSTVGSANWDERSFKLNYEANIECLSKTFAAKLTQYFENKRKKARKLELKEVENYSLFKRLRNNAFRLLSPYL
ncbi:cardiolipin synthase [Elusimicrobium posterum]|uniref:phospholipase D-like domain-containing protein n=1 Tax=Elusimicrobium posterum TaxID=3116653 RepID=UPI003C745765